MDVIVANLKGEAAEWVTILHDKAAPELGDPESFFCRLRAQFGDPTQMQREELEVQKELDPWLSTFETSGESQGA